MVEAAERIIDLAMYLAAHGTVTAREIRENVAGYSADQNESAFARMFERDKEWLREGGFVIVAEPGADSYRLDRDATFASAVELSPAEAAAVRAAGLAMLDDPTFPFAGDLRSALAKLATDLAGGNAPAASRLAETIPAEQAADVALLHSAIDARKRVGFGYTNSQGGSRPHDVEPYGLFAREGLWYLVGRDTRLDEQRVYTVARMRDIAVNESSPRTPDFEVPAGFDVSTFIGLPFQYGAEQIEAVLHFSAEDGWRAEGLASGHGTLEVADDESATWRVTARDRARLLRWLVENGPGIRLVAPAEIADELRAALEEVASLHG